MFGIILILVCIGLFFLYFFMTMGKPVCDCWLKDYDYAHRGLHSEEVPENSIPAFEHAIRQGYAIELDVHRSKDGILVVFHDDDLERMTGRKGRIEDLALTELQTLRLAGTEEKIPTFDAVLKAVGGKVPLLIELKNTGRAGRLEVDVCERLKSYKGKFAVQSFSPYSMRWFYKHAPQVLRGQLSATFEEGAEAIPAWQRWGLRHLLTNVMCRPNFINYEKNGVKQPIVERLRKSGVPVFAWTIRSEEERKAAEPYIDALVFEQFEPQGGKRAQ